MISSRWGGEAGEIHLAAKRFRHLADIDPRYIRVSGKQLNDHGLEHYDSDRSLMRAYYKAALLYGGIGTSYYGLIASYKEEGDLESAIRWATRCMDELTLEDACFGYAIMIWLEQGNIEMARQAAMRVIDLPRTWSWVRYQAGLALYKADQFALSQRQFVEYLKKEPVEYNGLYYLYDISAQGQGDDELILPFFKEALDRYPENFLYLTMYTGILEEVRPEMAAPYFERIIDVGDPDNDGASIEYAREALGRLKKDPSRSGSAEASESE